jgi:DNA-binding winged helix-turn-helix (wHTH) protein/tetratricopeptide (TPR) repeat protein
MAQDYDDAFEIRLSREPPFRLGALDVSPATRQVCRDGRSDTLEPRIMQVLVAFAQSEGEILGHDVLIDRCWEGRVVGENAIHRAVSKVRDLGSNFGGGTFAIETITKVGYRMRVRWSDAPAPADVVPVSESRSRVSRRMMLGSAAAAGVAAVGGVGLWSIRSTENRRFDELMDLGKQAQLYGDRSNKDAEYFQQAATMRPDDPKAQGLFALTQAMVAEDGGAQAGAAVQRADRAARVALAVDPDEPNARLALLTLHRSTLDLATNEDRLREILAKAPNNIPVMDSLWGLLQSAGRSRDALALVERANTLEPFAASTHFPKAQLLWILGRIAEADRVIDRAMQYWPEHEIVRFARFTIYTYTGRPRAALAMLDNWKTRPFYTPAAVSLWRVSLAALDQRSPTSIAAARRANLEAARQNPGLTNQAVLVLSALGELDAAFEIANQLLLFRRPVEARPQAGSAKSPVKSTSWRTAPWLFTPPAEPMQADPRFTALCDGIGLTEYWAKRGVKPDYQLRLT